MAVIISDMEFPKRCLDCQLMGREKMYCQLHPRKDLNVVRVVSEKPEWCPLKEVPTGQWEWEWEMFGGETAKEFCYCSNCKQGHYYDDDMNYCPNCGAKMIEP